MAFYDSTWYTNFGNGTSTGYYAVTVRPQNTAVAAGVLRRQFTAPAVGSERVFVCIVAGTTANTTDATWVLTRGAKTTDGTATWQECTGASAVNGDLTNTATWTQAKAIGTPTLGAIIQRNNGASFWICSTAGTLGASEPAWANNTAGTTQADGTSTWTCLGVVGNFSGGGAPHARLANASASTWFAAGNTIYVGDNHTESQTTAINITPAGSITSSSKILCHNHSGSYPPVSADLMTGATISTTAASVNLTFNPTGTFYIYGLTFKAGVGVSTAVNSMLLTASTGAYTYFDNCSFWLSNSTASNVSQLQVSISGAASGMTIFNNTTVRLAVATNIISTGNGVFIWQNTGQVLASGSAVPNAFLALAGASLGVSGSVVLEAIDLSQLTGSLNVAAGSLTNVMIKDCKLNASMTVNQPTNPGAVIQFVRSDSAATAYLSARYTYEGTETTDASITRIGGAVDPTGQAQSRKITTTANAQWLRPFRAEPYALWNPTTGSNVTVTVYGTINAGAVPNNDDLFMEVEYLSSSGSPLGAIVSTTKSNLLASNAAVALDNSTWNGGGSGSGWSPFKLTTTLSSAQPGMAGYLYARVRAAKASTTYYLDPKIELT